MNMQARPGCTWFLRATVCLPPGRKFKDVLEDQKTRRAMSLQAASYSHAQMH